MLKFRLTRTEAAARLTEVIAAILASEEWVELSQALPCPSWSEVREPCRRFFDVYERGDRNGDGWLGIMEWAVIEEMRHRASSFAADPATVGAIVARMERHPSIQMT